MGAYKQFLASDIVVTPFEVNKAFHFEGASELTASGVGIDRFLGTNVTGTFNPISDPTTGQVSTQYQRLVYDSIQQLYYSNYLSSSYGDSAVTASLIPGADTAGDRLVGGNQTSNYFNYLQTTLTYPKYFPTASDDIIGVISIPSRLYGNLIQPNSFVFIAPSGSLRDDGEGNILDINNDIVGNIFYYQGLITISSAAAISLGYGFATYGNAIYGGSGGDNTSIINYITSSNITCSFSSSLTIYETQYKCTMRENEFNFSQNPSLSSGSTSISSSAGTFFTPGQYLTNNVTGSYFSPYVTTVGLYDENQNLLAVGKLSQPLPVSPTTDTTILINLDR
jgi:hypothetical protein